jgi:hemin uptake protein HemP
MNSNPKKPLHIQHLSADITASTNRSVNLPVHESSLLLSGKSEAVIMHAGEAYRLKLTRQGKLILTK